MILMIPSFSNRTAPAKPSRPSSTRRSMTLISPISPSSFIHTTFRATVPITIWDRAGLSHVEFFENLLTHFTSQHVNQVLLRRLLHGGERPESLDQQLAALLADARQIFELAVQDAFRAAAAVRRDCEAVRLV